ncbi:MAG: insulinase family protein, partial [Bacteroidales bacterium]|nr:insulinase family protein [Bacteroidales bacterium]
MIKQFNLLLGLAFLLVSGIQAQDLSTKLQLDPSIKYGKLDNGFTYYIKHNEEPENRMEMRLVVNAGSVLENDSQQGIAHLLEHMCFNGTEHFEKSAIVDFIESTGVKFGQHLNAYTSFDETVYMLQMPVDRTGLVDTAFLIMEDWAHNVSLESEEIDKERGVVIEEWRLGLGADERMRQQYFPVLLKGSKYANRVPIGKKEIIENCPYDTIRAFYHDWYRPDLMAMIVVGDVDPAAMETKIKEHFAHIENPENERKRVEFSIPDNKEPLIAVATDEEATYSMTAIFYKHPRDIKTTVGDYRDLLKERLYNGMVNARLAEIMQKPTAPFMYGYTGYGGFFGRTKEAYNSFAIAKPGQIREAIEVMAEENERVEKFGFVATEFERQKQELLRSFEKQYNERDKMESKALAMEYAYNFLGDEPVPGIEAEYEMAKALVPGITLDEMNQLAERWITDENIAILVTAPENEDVKVPTEKEILEALKSAQGKDLQPYVDNVSSEPLIPHEIKTGEIVNIESKGEYEHWKLSNGAEVFIKPTDFKND